LIAFVISAHVVFIAYKIDVSYLEE